MKAYELIAGAAPGSAVTLPSGELEGPLVINKPLRLIGKNTTIWAKTSPVIQIDAANSSIENLRVEITEGSIEEPAVVATAAAAAQNVEVLGRVSGFGAEDGWFDIPRTIALGEFPAEFENTYKLEVNVPADTEIICELREITFEPKTLKAGRSELVIKVNGISAQMFLYAEVLFRSQFTRRIYITGKPDSKAAKAELRPVYTAPQRDFSAAMPPPVLITAAPEIPVPVQPSPTQAMPAQTMPAQTMPAQAMPAQPPPVQPVPVPTNTARQAPVQAPPPQFNTPQFVPFRSTPVSPPPRTPNAGAAQKTDVISMGGTIDPSLPHLDMRRGQRVGLPQYVGMKFKILFSASAPKGYEIDPYVFLLKEEDKAIGDDGLVFFGNPQSPDGCVRYFNEDGHVEVDLTLVPPHVRKIAVTYSIYNGNKTRNFRSVFRPRIALCAGGERISYSVDGLNDETTIVALEFYIYKGEWKVSAVGAGFKDGLAKLCNHYGIEVE